MHNAFIKNESYRSTKNKMRWIGNQEKFTNIKQILVKKLNLYFKKLWRNKKIVWRTIVKINAILQCYYSQMYIKVVMLKRRGKEKVLHCISCLQIWGYHLQIFQLYLLNFTFTVPSRISKKISLHFWLFHWKCKHIH